MNTNDLTNDAYRMLSSNGMTKQPGFTIHKQVTLQPTQDELRHRHEVSTIRGTVKHLNRLTTNNEHMKKLKERVIKLAPESYPVLILGESGTGKELIARALHGERGGKFVSVNCGGFPEHIVDSILFGHVKGSFTGADKDKDGLFQAANGGTIFLDEIGDLPLHMQAKLLRFLQEKEIQRVGDNDVYKVDVRVVSATNILKLENTKAFRKDLYWRLSTFTIRTIPLRERRDDIRMYVESQGIDWNTFVNMFSDILMKDINLMDWDGNYRELQSYIAQIKVLGTL